MFSVDHAKPGGTAVKVSFVLTPHVLVLAQVLLDTLLAPTNFVQDVD